MIRDSGQEPLSSKIAEAATGLSLLAGPWSAPALESGNGRPGVGSGMRSRLFRQAAWPFATYPRVDPTARQAARRLSMKSGSCGDDKAVRPGPSRVGQRAHSDAPPIGASQLYICDQCGQAVDRSELRQSSGTNCLATSRLKWRRERRTQGTFGPGVFIMEGEDVALKQTPGSQLWRRGGFL